LFFIRFFSIITFINRPHLFSSVLPLPRQQHQISVSVGANLVATGPSKLRVRTHEPQSNPC
jgi:hypothetical protein